MCKVTALAVGDLPAAWRDLPGSGQPGAGVCLVGEASNEAQAVELAHELRPDVILLNVSLGTQLVQRLRQENSSSAVMMVMTCPDRVKAREAFRAGSSACCRQDLSPHQMLQALCQVAQGHYVLDDQVFDKEGLQAQLTRAAARRRPPADPRLTRRQLEILQYVTQGLSNKEIALALGISQPTVKNHITCMLGKLRAMDRTQMAVNALRQGLVRLQDA